MTHDILLPLYGTLSEIRPAVESVLNQESPSWRLHVLDNCSPDTGIRDWFADLTCRDSRITYHRHSSNLGLNGNFRVAVSAAENPTFTMMGSDDVMLPNYVSLVERALVSGPAWDVLQPGVRVIDESGQPRRGMADRAKFLLNPAHHGTKLLTGEVWAKSVLRGNWTYLPSLVWNTAAVQNVGGFRAGLEIVLDLALQVDIAMAGGSLLVTDEVCFHYRRHRGSASSSGALDGSRFDEERQYFRTTATALDQMRWHRAARAARWHWMSRVNALSQLPAVVRTGTWRSTRLLLRHLFL